MENNLRQNPAKVTHKKREQKTENNFCIKMVLQNPQRGRVTPPSHRPGPDKTEKVTQNSHTIKKAVEKST